MYLDLSCKFSKLQYNSLAFVAGFKTATDEGSSPEIAQYSPYYLPLNVFTASRGSKKSTSRQRSGKGAIRKRIPLQKPRWDKNQTNKPLYFIKQRKSRACQSTRMDFALCSTIFLGIQFAYDFAESIVINICINFQMNDIVSKAPLDRRKFALSKKAEQTFAGFENMSYHHCNFQNKTNTTKVYRTIHL